MTEECGQVTPREMVEDMLKLMERGARMRLDCVPNETPLLSASFGTAHTPEMAKVIRAALVEAALTELALLGQEIEGEQEKRDREIRNKALEEAAGKVEKLAERYPDDTPVESQLSNAVFAIRALKEPS